jgi:hypothetical protein
MTASRDGGLPVGRRSKAITQTQAPYTHMTTLTAKNYKQLLTQPGRYRDTLGEIKGLMLVVTNPCNASWQLRFQRNGNEHWMGLGSARLLGLSEARQRARAARLQLLDGVDPLAAKRQAKAAAQVAAHKTLSFAQAANQYHAQHEHKWKNHRYARQVLNSLRQHA